MRGAALLVVLAAVSLLAGCGEAARPKHLILITIDTLRRDHLGTYGHPGPITPNLDALADRGVRLDDALAQSIATSPSHASMLTGLYPPRHGLRKLRQHRLHGENQTLAEILRAHGFATGAFPSATPLRRQVGLDQGFDHYDDTFGENGERIAEETNRQVKRWLEPRGDEHLFLWVHYFDPHLSYDPPPSHRATGGLNAVGDAKLGSRFRNTNPDTGKIPPRPPPPPHAVDLGRSLYEEEVHYTDRALGDLLSFLEAKGILDEAVVSVVSDHGECLGEEGYFFGHRDVYDATARIPMLLAHPSRKWAGRVVAAPVGTIDLMPTLLSWLGIEPPEGLDGEDLTVLLEDADGPEASKLRRRVIYTEQRESFVARAVRSAEWALFARPGSPEGALARRGPDPPEEAAAEARRRLTASLTLFQGSEGHREEELELSPATAELLQKLGYVE